MNSTEIISHLYQDTSGAWVIQTNADHCSGVAELTAKFAGGFGMAYWGQMLGLLHDRGKERLSFQNHIRTSSGFDNCPDSGEGHHHSYIGAILAHRLPHDAFCWLSNAIAGHHRGLYDMDELELILKQEIPKEINQFIPELKLEQPPTLPDSNDVSHLVRMLFSCLVDADRLDTERFMHPLEFMHRGTGTTMMDLKIRLDAYRKQFSTLPETNLNTLRTQIQQICEIKGTCAPGFFELNVPTGGGKTIASIIWAVNHALSHDKQRIIIAIPFTSIIVQTAKILRDIFGNENVIEHHSAVNTDRMDKHATLACENWDAPIVVTTNVQLFESIFSNRPASCRKLHSLCNSVVILDEIQSLPLKMLQPIIDCMKTYAKLFNTSFLFSTASQPVLDGEHKGLGTARLHGLPEKLITPIIDHDMSLHNAIRRCELQIDTTPTDIATLSRNLAEHQRVLCIVNTRNLALKTYQQLTAENVTAYHLSRMMCPAHILDTIYEIKHLLTDTGRPVRVISTQLIEAGVDIDFPVVYRQLAGLDSLLQAAGRCNREEHMPSGITHVFQINGFRAMGSMGFAIDAMKRMISLHPDSDWFAPEVMSEYYDALYSNTPSFDEPGITGMLDSFKNCQFETAAGHFKLIEESGITVIVNYGEAESLVAELQASGPSRDLSRRLGRYCVSIPQRMFADLESGGLITQPHSGFFYIPLKEQYDPYTGLKTDNEYLEHTMII